MEYEEIIDIANQMRSKGASISTHDIELAIRLYRTARNLSGYNYFPLKMVLESVFVKRKEYEKIFDQAFMEAAGGGTRYKNSGHRHLRMKSIPRDTVLSYSRKKHVRNEKQYSWRELEETSISKLRKEGLNDPFLKEKIKLARQLRNMERYFETKDTAYLDLLETELMVAHKRWGNRNSIEGKAIDKSFKKIYENLIKLVNNPNDPNALILLAREVKGEFAVKAMKYSYMKGNKALAEHIASSILKVDRNNSIMKEMKKYGWETSLSGSRIELRKTVYNITRGYPNKLVYKRRKKEKKITLIIDKSDSMRKYAHNVIEIAARYYPYTEKIILFDEKVEITRIKPYLSKAYLLDKLLKLDFSGYTNITRALREAMKEAKPGSGIVIISDFEQTIEDEPYYEELERLAKKKHIISIYTLTKYIQLLRRRLSYSSTGIRIRSLEKLVG